MERSRTGDANAEDLLGTVDRELLAFRQRIMKGRGMLLVPEAWCSALGGILEPWSIVLKDGIEYVVIPDRWLDNDGDGFLVKPMPEPDPAALFRNTSGTLCRTERTHEPGDSHPMLRHTERQPWCPLNDGPVTVKAQGKEQR